MTNKQFTQSEPWYLLRKSISLQILDFSTLFAGKCLLNFK